MRRSALVLIVACLAALPAQAAEIRVFAAASLRSALDRVAADHEAATGDDVTISYAGSGTLARQILLGAPADIFVSANTGWMDEVAKAGLIAGDRRRDILGNRLVLIAHEAMEETAIGPDLDLSGMLGDGRLAMALVDSVPAGQYGKAALEYLGLWDSVAPAVAQADNVRAALALVATGEAPLGIVYATDARAEPQVRVIGTFPEESHPPITYPAALLDSAADEADLAFFDALSAPSAAAIFAAEGFTVLD